MKNILTLLTIYIALISNGFSQGTAKLTKKSNPAHDNKIVLYKDSSTTNQNNEKSKELEKRYKKLDGTYQIQLIRSRGLADFNLDMLKEIEEKRAKKDTIYISVKPTERIMILPKDVIDKPNFKRIAHVKHVYQ